MIFSKNTIRGKVQMKFIKSLIILPLILSVSITSYADQYICPTPNEIKVMSLIPSGMGYDNEIWELWYGPAMSTSKGGAIGVGFGFGTDISIGNFAGSQPETIMINGQPVPGYSCNYYTIHNASADVLGKQVDLLPAEYQPIAKKLMTQGGTLVFGTLAYIAK
jgi:hypothetical protein